MTDKLIVLVQYNLHSAAAVLRVCVTAVAE